MISAGCTVRIMGGTVLRNWIPNPTPGLELLPLCRENSATFLRGLDCFLYRTHDNWFETFGRVVFEAMACGLPVVAHRRGGIAADSTAAPPTKISACQGDRTTQPEAIAIATIESRTAMADIPIFCGHSSQAGTINRSTAPQLIL